MKPLPNDLLTIAWQWMKEFDELIVALHRARMAHDRLPQQQ
jgi:hypothetical protein